MTQTLKNPPAMRETSVRSLGQEDPLEKGMATHSSMLLFLFMFHFILLLNLFVFLWPCRVFIPACGIFSWHMGTLGGGRWYPGPRAGIEPGSPVLGTQSLSYWTTREVPAGDSS